MKFILMTPLSCFLDRPPNLPDLGLAYLASALIKQGHDVYVKDWNRSWSVERFRQWLNEVRPESIGIKVFTKDVKAAQKTIEVIRNTLNDIPIVLGGPHPSACDPSELMEDFPECNYAMKGEAELSLPILLSLIEGANDKKFNKVIPFEKARKVSGLIWKEKDNIHSNPISLISNLDTIDFPFWELFDPKEYSDKMFGSSTKEGRVAPIITTRGCPGKCTFCSAHNISGRKIRYRSPENILDEILILYNQYNVRQFMFQDNCFTSIKENLTSICELILQADISIEWDCVSYERLDNLTDNTLNLMYRAGCRMIHIGVDSVNENIRKKMRKFGSLNQITSKIRAIQGNGIKVGAWFMIGFPDETKEEMIATRRYAFSLGVDSIHFTTVFPLPGTEIYNDVKNKYKCRRIDWAEFDLSTSVYPMSQLSSKALRIFLKMTRLRIVFGQISKIFKKVVR